MSATYRALIVASVRGVAVSLVFVTLGPEKTRALGVKLSESLDGFVGLAQTLRNLE